MSEAAGVLVSVRGEARRTVPPDSAVIAGVITATRDSKADAARAAASALEVLTADLAAIGGVALSVDTLRQPLTWSAHSAATREENAYDKRTGEYSLTGKMTTTVSVQLTVRALDLLDVLGSRMATHEALAVREVSWHVDWDNPAWPDVRAAAIQAAIAKGRDYAAALGGRLSTVEHIADPGFLAEDGQRWNSGGVRFTSSGGGEGSDAPSLDPVPQVLTALIEARFIADGITLTPDSQGQI
jgi:uncharacterized protein